MLGTVNSPIERIATNSVEDRIDGRSIGMEMRRLVEKMFRPLTSDASSRVESSPRIAAEMNRYE